MSVQDFLRGACPTLLASLYMGSVTLRDGTPRTIVEAGPEGLLCRDGDLVNGWEIRIVKNQLGHQVWPETE